jgi:protein mago nashi
VSQSVIDEMRRVVLESGILECKDTEWPKPDKIGKQELVVRVGGKEVSLQTSKIGSYAEVQKTKDPAGLTVFFYLVQDLKCFVFSLVNLHFRVRLPALRSSPSDPLQSSKLNIKLAQGLANMDLDLQSRVCSRVVRWGR